MKIGKKITANKKMMWLQWVNDRNVILLVTEAGVFLSPPPLSLFLQMVRPYGSRCHSSSPLVCLTARLIYLYKHTDISQRTCASACHIYHSLMWWHSLIPHQTIDLMCPKQGCTAKNARNSRVFLIRISIWTSF